MERRLVTSVKRIALSALLLGLTAGTAQGQIERDHDPRAPQRQFDTDWRQPTDSSPRRMDNDYDDYDDERGADVDVGFFYNELSPYGEWVRHSRYGWAWFPSHVSARWRPYSLGRWVDSDYGWTWASDEPFGWATYHYGRWAWDSEIGWLWVPGTDWAPAWVAWQQGNGYVGWAPLPPAVGFEIGVGIRLGGFDLSLGIAPRDYTFVEERRLLDPRIGGFIVPEARNVTIIHNTRNVTRYTVTENRVINHGVSIERIEQVTGRRARRLRVATAPNSRSLGVQGDVIRFYRPAAGRLETVRVARRNNAGLPDGAPSPNWAERQTPNARPQGAAPMPVAPRTRPAPRTDSERQFLREQRDLRESQARDRQALEQGHRRETAEARAKANAKEVAERQAAEVKAQQEQRQRADRQLKTRQQIQRRAAEADADKARKPKKNDPKPKPNHPAR